MTAFLADLAPWMPWILAGMGLLALLVLGVIAWLLLGNTVPEGATAPPMDEEEDGGDAPSPWSLEGARAGLTATASGAGAAASSSLRRAGTLLSPILIRNAVRKGYRAIRAYAPRRTIQRSEPWILVLGPEGSGQTELLEGLTLPRVLPELAQEAVGWYVFDQGIVLDVPESLVYTAAGTADDRGWDAFLAALVRVRAERPADGVVLVLPARALFDPTFHGESERAIEGLADQIFERLQRAQSTLGLRFPVHVLIHGIEIVPGFKPFALHIPEGMRHDPFGWSCPYPLESAYQSDWVADAFRDIRERLNLISTEILATRATGDEANAVFRFPERFEGFRERTQLLLDTLFRDTAYHEGFFLRGIHFSARSDIPMVSAGPLAGITPPSLFTTRLFQRKIFPERGLATVFRSGLLDRNRRVRFLQLVAAFLIVFGLPALWVGSMRLKASTAAIEDVLLSLENSIEQMREIRSNPNLSISASGVDDSVFVALAHMSELTRRDFRSLALPDSWIRPLDPLIDNTLRLGIQEVVIPILREALLEWADTLRGQGSQGLGAQTETRSASSGLGAAATGSIAAPLSAYLVQVDSLVQNIGHYNAVATSDELAPFEKLVNWYFEQPLPPGFKGRGSFVRQALAEARDEPIRAEDRPDFNDAVLARSTRLVESVYADLLDRVEALDGALSAITSGQSEFLADDLLRLLDDMAQLERFLDRSGNYWLNTSLELGDEVETILAGLQDQGIFSGSLFALQFRRDFDRIRATRLTELSQLPSFARVIGAFPLSDQGADQEARLAPALEGLASGIRLLGAQRFMSPLSLPATSQPASGDVPQFGALPRWAPQPLEEVIRLLQEARTFETASLELFPAALHGAVRDVIAQASEDRVREAVSAAMIWERSPEPSGRREQERELGIRIQNFDESARSLIRIMELDDGPGGSRGLIPVLAQVMLTEVLDLLLLADRLLEESRPYQADFARWRGTTPAAYAAFGVNSAEELDTYLAQQRELLETLSTRYVSRILAYVSLPPIDQQVRFGASGQSTTALERLARWQGISRALDQFETQEPGNPLGALERLIRFDLQAVDASGCPEHAAASPALISNYFVLTAQRLDRGFRQRCAALARIQIETQYAELQSYFQANLAGRAPFVAPGALSLAPEVDAFSVREWLRRYERLTQSLGPDPSAVLRSLPEDQEAARFLRELGALEPILKRVLGEPDQPETAGLGVRLEFRTSRSLERGADQLVEWAAQVGGETLRLGETPDARTVIWRPGEPVALQFRWASGSTRRPLSTAGGVLLDASRIEFRHTGPWALLRLIAAAALTAESQRSLGLPTGPLEPGTLVFAVPTAGRVGAAGGAPPTGPGELSLLFVRIRLFDPVTGAALEFPRFPVQAPVLRFEQP